VLGAIVNLGDEPSAAEAAVFNERGARAVVSVSPSKLAAVLNTARQYSVAAHQIGQVIRGDALRIQYKGSAVIDSSVEALRDTWAHSLERILVKE
jgi:phosphoribosylformylglycinamidine (FGAM) synthase-like enzyme